jgi:hypothetical protein
MALITRKAVARYLYESLTGNFLGFLIGLSASGLVSKFFETKGLRNLWGLTAKKAVVSKETFGRLEWLISLVIGFIVFEIVNRVLKPYLEQRYPAVKNGILRFIIHKQWHLKFRRLTATVRIRRVALYAMIFTRKR